MKKLKSLAAATFAAMLIMVPSAAQAKAACPVPPFDCPYPSSLDDAFCVYDNVNYQGFIDFWDGDLPRNFCVRIEQGPQYKADSLYNNTSLDWRYFRTGDCSGSHMTIRGYTSIPRLADGWRNAVVAFSRTSTVRTCS